MHMRPLEAREQRRKRPSLKRATDNSRQRNSKQ